MKRILYYTFFTFLAVTLTASCSDDGDEGTVIPPVDADEAVAEFFNEALPEKGHSNSFFCHLDTNIHMIVPIWENFVYVINNREQLEDFYQGDKELPEIDFRKYTLIIGQQIIGCLENNLVEKRLTVDEEGLHLYLHTKNDDEVHSLAIQLLHYWGLYPKLQQKLVSLDVFHEYTKMPETNVKRRFYVNQGITGNQ